MKKQFDWKDLSVTFIMPKAEMTKAEKERLLALKQFHEYYQRKMLRDFERRVFGDIS